MRNKKYIFIFILSLFNGFIFANLDESYYLFELDGTRIQASEKYTIPLSKSDQELKMLNIIKILEEKFDCIIESQEIVFNDTYNRRLIGLEINIKTGSKYSNFESYSLESNFATETILINLLQPFSSKWYVKFLILKINGEFYFNDEVNAPITSSTYIDHYDYYFNTD